MGAVPFATATQYWLETRVRLGTSTGAFTILPVRQKLNAVPYALNVRTLPPGIVTGASLAPNAVGPVAILDNSITATDIGVNAVGLAEINPTQVQTRVSGICASGFSMRAIAQNGTVTCEVGGSNAWRLLGNTGTNSLTQFLGTTDNQPLNLRVNNQRVLRLEPNAISPNIIGGNRVNFVTAGVRGATIGGGGVPTGDTDPDFVDEGPNRVTDAYGTVSGGYNNQAGDNAGTVIDLPFATVGGGNNNTASGIGSTVAGGITNTASDVASTVAGGRNNTASSSDSTVAGGRNNTASGPASTVAGGASNIASGERSFAAGTGAKATHEGMFVWSDSSTNFRFIPADDSVTSGGLANGWTAPNNTFNVRATGGVWFVTGVSNNTGVGAYLQPGSGSWGSGSSRTYKSDFAPVDADAVFKAVVTLPLSYWRYSGEAKHIRHLGPVAEDFRQTFALGSDDKSITTVDADGVAMVAIQGLNRKLEQENAKLKAKSTKLEAENTTIKARLTALEKQTATHTRTHAWRHWKRGLSGCFRRERSEERNGESEKRGNREMGNEKLEFRKRQCHDLWRER